MIPELVGRIDYYNGPYAVQQDVRDGRANANVVPRQQVLSRDQLSTNPSRSAAELDRVGTSSHHDDRQYFTRGSNHALKRKTAVDNRSAQELP